MFITGVNDAGDKFITGVFDNNPCHGFSVIAGVVDTAINFSPVTTTPTINLLPVTTTPVNNYRR